MAPEHQFSTLCFFETLEACLSFVQTLRANEVNGPVSPSSIEFYGPNAIGMIRDAIGTLSLSAQYGVWCEQDTPLAEEDQRLEAWFDLLEGSGALVEETLFAQDPNSRDRLATMRHAVPAAWQSWARETS